MAQKRALPVSGVLAATSSIVSQAQRREREQQLLWAGEQFRRATLDDAGRPGDGQVGPHHRGRPVRRDDGSWLVDGMTPVDEFEELVGVPDLNEDEGFSTVAGLVMHLLRTLPKFQS